MSSSAVVPPALTAEVWRTADSAAAGAAAAGGREIVLRLQSDAGGTDLAALTQAIREVQARTNAALTSMISGESGAPDDDDDDVDEEDDQDEEPQHKKAK